MMISVESTYQVDRLRDIRGVSRQAVRIGAPDPTLTSVSGMAAVTELVDRLGLIEYLDGAVGPIKRRNRGHGAGELRWRPVWCGRRSGCLRFCPRHGRRC
jgi:hypothetical protein